MSSRTFLAVASADAAGDISPYGPVLIVIVIAVLMAGVILCLSHLLGPKRSGGTKSSVYESGMPPISDARRRFNVRFYIVAMLFLLFDVEVVILWPWALAYYEAAAEGVPNIAGMGADLAGKGLVLGGATLFLLLLLVGYAYEWKKGMFRWN